MYYIRIFPFSAGLVSNVWDDCMWFLVRLWLLHGSLRRTDAVWQVEPVNQGEPVRLGEHT